MVEHLYCFREKDNTTVICTKSPQKFNYNIQNHLPHFTSSLLQYFSGVHKVWKLCYKHAMLETVLGQHNIDEVSKRHWHGSSNNKLFLFHKRNLFYMYLKSLLSYYNQKQT